MTARRIPGRVRSVADLGSALRRTVADLFAQEFSYSTGHLAAILNGCLFAPSILTFWFVNGVLDFSTAVAIGAVATPAGLQLRLMAYLLLMPTFLLARVAVHLAHPTHRRQVLTGSCPNTRLLSLDWISMGILATGLPLALRNLGPWLGMNAVFAVGIFLLPRYLPERLASGAKLAALGLGGATFLYAAYGGAVAALPVPAATLGPVATVSLSDHAVSRVFRAVNSVAIGPLLVGVFGSSLNRILTRPELADIPVLRHSLPRRDPDFVVAANAAFGTVFYLTVVGIATGHVVVVP